MYQKEMVRYNSWLLFIRGLVGVFLILFVFNKACENHLLTVFIVGFIPIFISVIICCYFKEMTSPKKASRALNISMILALFMIAIIFKSDIKGIVLSMLGFIPLIQAYDEEMPS
ncbi:hypothetical protein AOC36_07865 [Erysipelothrix larvae]|uniref:Uncharacterized protein n=1 Tax=Erysipelothrix larvae TaxID=1514105 RepID=A0A109UH96_9FIRM|nr:hypothetical protein [Erysipelothrix larvae]AMC93902.1 hypothetical protein AOC36_07865 [Erysipelothrix larvae]